MKLVARFVVPDGHAAIENGAVEIRHGVIADVGQAKRVGGSPMIDHGDAVILPGLINAHTHLELSPLVGRVPPGLDFCDWLRRLVIELRQSPFTPESAAAAVRDGAAQSLAAGVTTVGDITRCPAWTRAALATTQLRVVSFGEIIALGTVRHVLGERIAAATAMEMAGARLHIGLSPHAPYTIEPEGLRACAVAAHANQMAMCIHLAETREEELFTDAASGPLAAFLQDMNLWDDDIPAGKCRPVALAERCRLLTPRTILAHANYVSDEDLATLARRHAHVAFCPRTHAAFGHPPHRFRDMLVAGINVCLGTDSLASNPSLSLMDEMRFLRRNFPDLSAHTLLELGTVRGARALGVTTVAGSLRAGVPADVSVWPLARHTDRWDAVFEYVGLPLAVYADGVAVS